MAAGQRVPRALGTYARLHALSLLGALGLREQGTAELVHPHCRAPREAVEVDAFQRRAVRPKVRIKSVCGRARRRFILGVVRHLQGSRRLLGRCVVSRRVPGGLGLGLRTRRRWRALGAGRARTLPERLGADVFDARHGCTDVEQRHQTHMRRIVAPHAARWDGGADEKKCGGTSTRDRSGRWQSDEKCVAECT